MGVKGLLNLLKPIQECIHVRNFSHKTAGIDAYCILHRSISTCARDLALNKPTKRYVQFFIEYVQMLLDNNIKPVVVFDGQELQGKAIEEERRSTDRENNLRLALRFEANGDREEAEKYFKSSVEVSSTMVAEVIQVLQDLKVDYIVSPYEADAQLAFLNAKGITDFVISEDSDLLPYGVDLVLFKLNKDGWGDLIRSSRIDEVLGLGDNYSLSMLQYTCIIAGCDYLPSLPGIGIKRALKFTQSCTLENIEEKLDIFGNIVGLRTVGEIPDSYKTGLQKALEIFNYQMVYSPTERKTVSLKQRPSNLSSNNHNEHCVKKGWGNRERPKDPSLQSIWSCKKDDDVEMTVASFGDVLSWTIHCFPVLTIDFKTTILRIHGKEIKGLFQKGHTDRILPPHKIKVSNQCTIQINEEKFLVVWEWHPVSEGIKSRNKDNKDEEERQENGKENEEDSYEEYAVGAEEEDKEAKEEEEDEEEESWGEEYEEEEYEGEEYEEEEYEGEEYEEEEFEGENYEYDTEEYEEDKYEGEDEEYQGEEEEEEEEDEDEITHTLPFKVIGVAHTLETQSHLENACLLLEDPQPRDVSVKVKTEPENPKDKDAIAVLINYGCGWKRIGYIASELTSHVHLALKSHALAKCEIEHIKFRSHWFRPGFYMKLLLTRRGMWEKFVINKSRSVL